jgi:hypothetical protein
MPTHAFGEAIIETSKIHNLFIWYSNSTYCIALESSWNHAFREAIIETSKIHNLFIWYSNSTYCIALESSWKWGWDPFCHSIIVNSVRSSKSVLGKLPYKMEKLKLGIFIDGKNSWWKNKVRVHATLIIYCEYLTTLSIAYTVSHTIFLTLYSVGKLDEQWKKMDKICQYWWKTIEMDENMIDKCMNPQYWWTHSIWCIQCSD